MMRTVASRIALLTVGVLMAALLTEGALRLAGLGYGSAPLVSDPMFHHVHPRNYRFVMHDPGGEFGGHPVQYDAQGLVVDPTRPPARGSSASLRLVFFGDSFVEALQVPYAQSFVARVGQALGASAQVRNYGVSAYSPVLYLLLWEHAVHQWHPTHVFLLVSIGDSLDDQWYAARARYDAQGRIIAVSGPGDDWWAQQIRKSYMLRFLRKLSLQLAWHWQHRGEGPQLIVGGYAEEKDPQLSALISRTVATLASEVRASGARFVLMVVPSKYRLQGGKSGPDPATPEFSEKWRRWAKERNVEFLDLVGPFHLAARHGERLFFDRDIHLNCHGHRLVAGLILKRLGVGPDGVQTSESNNGGSAASGGCE